MSRRKAKDEAILRLLWHNKARLHSMLVYVHPMQFEGQWFASQSNS